MSKNVVAPAIGPVLEVLDLADCCSPLRRETIDADQFERSATLGYEAAAARRWPDALDAWVAAEH